MAMLPKLKLKAIVSFPSNVYGGTGIEVNKANGNFTVNLDYSEFGTSGTLPPNTNVLVWDPTTNTYYLVPPSAVGGISDAPSDSLTYGRNNAAWVQVTSPATATPVANVIINGDFRVNQGGYVSGAVLAAGLYGHDQWKAGASGGNYSFTQLKSSTQITIAAGKSLIQPIEDVNVSGGSYVLSWTGTAQARAGVNTLTPSGAYAGSPLLIAGQTAGTVMSVEFNTGTLGTVKLESGAVATPFIMRPYDQELLTCKRYWEKITAYTVSYSKAGTALVGIAFPFSVQKRATPAVSYVAGGTYANCSLNSNSVTTYNFTQILNITATDTYVMNQDILLDARL